MLETAEIIPLTGALGAEVSGVQLADLVKRNDNSNAEQLFQMLVENKVLIFRDQHPDPQTHVDVAKLMVIWHRLCRCIPKSPVMKISSSSAMMAIIRPKMRSGTLI